MGSHLPWVWSPTLTALLGPELSGCGDFTHMTYDGVIVEQGGSGLRRLLSFQGETRGLVLCEDTGTQMERH